MYIYRHLYIHALSFFILLSSTLAISEGHTVETSQQYPFFVTLTNPILCGGSIISTNPPWILTAAHCIEGFDIREENSSVGYGSRNFSRQSYTSIKRVVSHPLYVTKSQLKSQVYQMDGAEFAPYDIALIELAAPLIQSDHVDHIRLLDHTITKNDSSLETIGMGYTGIRQPHANVLQYALCSTSDSAPLRNNNYNDSIILSKSDAGLCHGDSGSPLLFKNGDYYLAGVLNRIMNAYDPDPENTSCPAHESNTSFTNVFVSPSAHMKWISETTGLSRAALTAAVTPPSIVLSSSVSGADYTIHMGKWIMTLLSVLLSSVSIFCM